MAVEKIENPGITGGMNIAMAANLIGKEQCEYAIDCIFDEPGIVKRRGGFTSADALAALPGGYQVLKSFTVQRVDGAQFIGMVCFLATGNPLYFVICDQNFTNFSAEPITTTAGVSNPLISVKPALGGGVWVGVSNQAEATGNPTTTGRQFLWLWKGSNFVSGSSVTTAAAPTAIGATTIPTTGLINNYVGGFVFNSAGRYVGTVASMAGGTLTLEKPAMVGTGASSVLNIRPIRGYIRHYAKGRITTSTANATVVNAGGDFTTLTNDYTLFRSSDNAYIGSVSSVQTSTTLTLTGNAAVNMANEPFWAVASLSQNTTTTPAATDPWLEPNTKTTQAPGWINTTHQGRQWFFNRNKLPDAAGDYVSRAWVSDLQMGEAIDFNITDGDFLQIGSGQANPTPILEAVSLQNQLLVFKEAEVFAVIGDAPSNYTSKKIFSDGILCTMAWDTWNDGVVWIGRRGVWYYDGVSAPINLVKDSMGRKWVDYVKAFSQANGNRAWLANIRDHAMVSLSTSAHIITPKAAGSTEIPISSASTLMPVIYIPTQALSFWSNMLHQGGFQMGGVLNTRNILNLRCDPLVTLTQGSTIVDTVNVFTGGTPGDKLVMNNGMSTYAGVTSATIPSTIPATPQLPSGIAASGTLYVNGDPNLPVTYTGINGGTQSFTGCSGGGSLISGVTMLTTAPVGPSFYIASRREDAGDAMLRKGWRQFTYTVYQPVSGNIGVYLSTNVDDAGVQPRTNTLIGGTGTTYITQRSRFGHTGYMIQWRLNQQYGGVTDIRLRGTDLFWKPQRQRRAS